MENTLKFAQIIIAVLLIISVLLQARGSQVGLAFGGSGETFRSKKGLERVLFYTTIILTVLFASISIYSLVLA